MGLKEKKAVPHHCSQTFHSYSLPTLCPYSYPCCSFPESLSLDQLDFCWSTGSGWILTVLAGRLLTAYTSSLLHGLFFLAGQKGEEEVQREGGSCRMPGAVWLQLSLAISEWASRWQAWSALLTMLGTGELCYLEQSNNPLCNFNISKVLSIYAADLQGATVCFLQTWWSRHIIWVWYDGRWSRCFISFLYKRIFFFFFGRGKNFLQNTIHQNMKWTIF